MVTTIDKFCCSKTNKMLTFSQIIPQEEVSQYTSAPSDLRSTPGAERSPGAKWRGSGSWAQDDDAKRKKEQVCEMMLFFG